MTKLIEFYVPNNFRRKVKWVPPKQRGKVIEFTPGSLRHGPAQPNALAGDFRSKSVLER